MHELMKMIEEYLKAFSNLVAEVMELRKRIIDLEDDVKTLKFGE